MAGIICPIDTIFHFYFSVLEFMSTEREVIERKQKNANAIRILLK
jgi:hypothetical protein